MGADQLSIDTLDAGMDGVIGGGGSSVMAKIFVNIWHLYKSGDKEQAQKLQDRMNQWCVLTWPACSLAAVPHDRLALGLAARCADCSLLETAAWLDVAQEPLFLDQGCVSASVSALCVCPVMSKLRQAACMHTLTGCTCVRATCCS